MYRVAVVGVVLCCVDSALGGDRVRTTRAVVEGEGLHLAIGLQVELAKNRSALFDPLELRIAGVQHP